MENKKYVMNRGLAFSEEKEMKKLSTYAREGWFLKKFAFFGFTLQKGEPQELDYSIDHQAEADEEYFSYFDEAGWTYVCSTGNVIHVFCAPKGTTPIYSDQETKKQRYIRESEMMKKVALPTLAISLMLLMVTISSANGLLPELSGQISEYLGYVAYIVLVFSGMPYVAYKLKIRKLDRGNF